MNVHDLAHSLAKGLKNSPQYKNYKDALAKIEGNGEKEQILMDLRMKQMEVQALQMMGKEVSPEKLAELEKATQLLNFHPTIREFLQAEFYLGQLLGDVQKIISEAVDLWSPEQLKNLMEK